MSEESIIGKFFGILGFKVDHAGVDEFKHSLESVKHAVEGLLMVEVGERIFEFIERSVGAAAAVNDLGEMTEMSAQKIDAMGRVAVENSSSVDAMKEAILGVYRATGQAAMGLGRNVRLFQALGLQAKDSSGHVKSAEDMMSEMADKFQTMDMAKVIATAGRLGIDPMIAKAMRELGGAGWRREISAALEKGLLSEQDYAQADKTEKTFKRLHLIVSQLSALVANQLAPWLRRAVDAVERFVVGNKVELIKKIHGAMSVLSTVLGTVWEWGSRLFDVMGRLVRRLEASKVAGEAFRLVFVAITAVKTAEIVEKAATAVNNLWMAMTKVPKVLGGMALIAVAVGLLVEDWMGFKAGEESVIGDLETRWPAAFKVITDAMNGLLGIWNDVLAAARSLGLVKAQAPTAGSMAWYRQMRETPPEPHSQQGELFAQMQEAERAGQLPWQQAGAQFQARHEAVGDLAVDLYSGAQAGRHPSSEAMSQVLAATEDQRARRLLAAQPDIAAVMADSGAARGTTSGPTVYVTGTRVDVRADTDARAATAGRAVRDALTSTQIRNYQPRGL